MQRKHATVNTLSKHMYTIVVTQLAINVMIFQYSQKHRQLRKIRKYLQWHDFNVNHGLFNYILTLQYMHIM